MVRHALLLSLIYTTPAIAACETPQIPFCVVRSTAFANDLEMQTCRIEMETYRRRAEDYATCRQVELLDGVTGLTTAAKADLGAVESDFLQAVDSFNRRAKSGN